MSELRPQWQHKRHWLPVFLIGVGAILFYLSIILLGWGWTGFAGGNSQVTVKEANEEKVYLMSKTLWDWMQLLLVPVALAAIALVFQFLNASTERKIAEQRYEQDKQIAKQRYEQDKQMALDKQREDLLQVYLDRIAELLLQERLVVLDPFKASCQVATNVARVRTITVLTQLDVRRVNYVFTFLRESRLMPAPPGRILVSLKDADFHRVEWGQANLRQANLSGAKLNEANLSGANLSEADLSGTNLSEADLSGANLSEAKVTDEQLKQVKSLQGATMPDGSKHP